MKGDKGFLKDKMQGYRVEPPVEVWQSVEAGIRGRGRRRLLIFSLAAAASLALAITVGISLFSPGDEALRELASSGEENKAATSEGALQEEGALEEDNVLRKGSESQEDGTKQEGSELQEDGALQEGSELLEDGALQEGSESQEEGALQEENSRQEDGASTGGDSVPLAYPGQPIIAAAEQDELAVVPENQAVAGEIALNEDYAEQDLLPDEAVVHSPDEAVVHSPDEAEVLSLEEGEVLSPEEAEILLEESMANVPGREEAGPIDVEVPGDPRWMLGAVFSPLYNYRDATDNALVGTTGQESAMISYAGGVQVAYRTTRRLALETGVLFNKMGLEIGSSGILNTAMVYDNMAVGSDRYNEEVKAVTNSMGNIVSNDGEIFVNNYKLNATQGPDATNNMFGGIQSHDGVDIEQHLDYLEVPVNLRYTLVDRSLKLQIVGGVSTNLLVNNYVTMEGPEGPVEIGYLSNVKNVNYSGNAGLGLAYYFFSSLSISVEPRFRYYLNSVNDGSLPATRPFTFGLYTGLSYIF